MSRLYIGDVDLSSVFQPYSSGPPTETRFYVNNVDIGSIFQLYGGSGLQFPKSSGFIAGASDMQNLLSPVPLVVNGLVANYNFNTTSYSGSGTNVTNLVTSLSDLTLVNTLVYNASNAIPAWEPTSRTFTLNGNV